MWKRIYICKCVGVRVCVCVCVCVNHAVIHFTEQLIVAQPRSGLSKLRAQAVNGARFNNSDERANLYVQYIYIYNLLCPCTERKFFHKSQTRAAADLQLYTYKRTYIHIHNKYLYARMFEYVEVFYVALLAHCQCSQCFINAAAMAVLAITALAFGRVVGTIGKCKFN